VRRGVSGEGFYRKPGRSWERRAPWGRGRGRERQRKEPQERGKGLKLIYVSLRYKIKFISKKYITYWGGRGRGPRGTRPRPSRRRPRRCRRRRPTPAPTPTQATKVEIVVNMKKDTKYNLFMYV
jgi:hypothetical protein